MLHCGLDFQVIQWEALQNELYWGPTAPELQQALGLFRSQPGFVSSSVWGSVDWSSGSQGLGFSLTQKVCQLEIRSPTPHSADSG